MVAGGDEVGVVFIAQDVGGGEDQAASIDDHARAILVGNEIRIGGQGRAANRRLAAERIGTRLQPDGIAALLLADPRDGHDGLLGRRNGLHQRVLDGGCGAQAREFIAANACYGEKRPQRRSGDKRSGDKARGGEARQESAMT